MTSDPILPSPPVPSLPPLPAAYLTMPGSARWWERLGPRGHIETLRGALRPLPPPPGAARRVAVPVAPGNAVETWWNAPAGPAHDSVLLVHGLGGSAHRPHVVGLADEAVRRGWHAVRVSLRNHGGTAHLGDTLFSAVQSDDIGRILEAMEAAHLPRPFAVVGVSLGGAMVLRYAAQSGDACMADAVAVLNPALDFFVVERAINRSANFIYRANFVRGLCRMVDEVRALRPVPGPVASPVRLRSIRRFDAAFTVPAAGFATVDDYYRAASARPLLPDLRVPTLMLTAADDPFVPSAMISAHHGGGGGRIQVAVTDRGGHVGYRVTDTSGRERFWVAGPVFDYLQDQLSRR